MAEDVAANRYLLKKLLGRLGIELDFAEHGKDAVEKFAAAGMRSYDLIIMDMQMPVMDGYEAAASIKGQSADVPIIALTAAAFDTDRRRCRDAGCDDVLHKPIDIDELEAVLCQYLT